jgi:hypothetical protein
MASFKERRSTFLSLISLICFVLVAIYIGGRAASPAVEVTQLHARQSEGLTTGSAPVSPAVSNTLVSSVRQDFARR